MSAAVIGLFAGLILALVGVVGGFGAFLLALVLGGLGLGVGLAVDGRLDLSGVLAGRRRG